MNSINGYAFGIKFVRARARTHTRARVCVHDIFVCIIFCI